tara:strand:+ start:64 stop:222 length:159 start_codon:yes stop_codon:yes gene_type:complete
MFDAVSCNEHHDDEKYRSQHHRENALCPKIDVIGDNESKEYGNRYVDEFYVR